MIDYRCEPYRYAHGATDVFFLDGFYRFDLVNMAVDLIAVYGDDDDAVNEAEGSVLSWHVLCERFAHNYPSLRGEVEAYAAPRSYGDFWYRRLNRAADELACAYARQAAA